MKTIGIFSIIFHSIFLAFGLMMFGTAFAGFGGETVMVTTAVLALLVWGAFVGLTIHAIKLSAALIKGDSSKRGACLTWSSKLFFTFAILSIASAWVIGFGYFAACGPAWLASLSHWAGLVGSVVGFVAWFLYPYIVRGLIGSEGGVYARPPGWRKPLITGSITYGVWGILWFVFWIWLSGPIDTSLYPDSASSPYQLPYPDGTSAWVVQGNNSRKNHNGSQQFAWDFRLSCGTPVVAARAGRVVAFEHSHTGYGSDKPNNSITVDHGDGTSARYSHIEQNSVVVNVGDDVTQGQTLAAVGNVGNSITGHIHFQVIRSGNSIAASFQDVDEDEGIPRAFNSYTSGN